MIRFAHAFRTPATPGDLAAAREPPTPLLPRRVRVAVVAAAVAFPGGCALGCIPGGTGSGAAHTAPLDVSAAVPIPTPPRAPALITPVCVAGQGRCDGDRPEVCRGEGADAAWWAVMVQGRPLACRDHGALCSVEPDGMAVCVVVGDSQ